MSDTLIQPAPAQPARTTASSGPAPTGGGAQRAPIPTAQQPNNPGLFSFAPLMDQSRQKFAKILVYGQAGSGKTTLAGSACNLEQTSDVLLITAEGGDMVFYDNDRINNPERIDMMPAKRIEQIQKVFEWLATHIAARKAGNRERMRKLQNIAFLGAENVNMSENDPNMPEHFRRLREYHTVVIDSLTDIEAQNMNAILGADEGFQIGNELQAAGYGEFRKNNNTIQQLVRAFRNLEIHLIIICGQRWMQDEQKRFHYSPWLTGQLSTQVQSFVDIVGYMVPSQPDPNQPPVRRLYVQPQATVKFDCKNRIASFKEPFFQDPTFADILRACKYLQ